MTNIYLENKYLLLLLLLLVPYIYWYFFIYPKKRIYFSTSFPINEFVKYNKIKVFIIRHLPLLLEIIIFIALVITLSKPVYVKGTKKISKKGYNIAFIIDISKSMETTFRNSTRINYVKKISNVLLNKLTYGNLYSLIYIAERPFLVISETYDKKMLKHYINHINELSLPKEGTAIADAVLLALSNFKNKGGIIILISDGGINRGYTDINSILPVIKKYKVPIFSIALGDSIVFDKKQRKYIKTDFNYSVLEKLSTASGGKIYDINTFNSTNLVNSISKLPKSNISEEEIKDTLDLYNYGAVAIIFLIIIYLLLPFVGIYNPLE